MARNFRHLGWPLLAIATLSIAQTASPTKLEIPGPDMQNRILGSWSINAQAAPAEKSLGSGTGTELWYAGPGGTSLIEELHIVDSQGHPVDAFGPAWWDAKAEGQRFIWCINNLSQGCVISDSVQQWQGERHIYRNDRDKNGHRVTEQEIFSDFTDHSFSQVVSEGPKGGILAPKWTVRATRLPAEARRMEFPADPVAAPPPDRAHADLPKMIDALCGTWSTRDSVAPGKASEAESGKGEEIFRAGPGRYSLIEQYRSLAADGASGLGIFWPAADGKTFQVLWCDSTDATGCRVLNGTAAWKNNQLSISEERSENGKKLSFREVFAFDSPNSFTQTLSSGEPGGRFETFLTVRATRKSRP